MKILKKICNSSNYTKNRPSKLEYIVIHYTANNGDTALGNAKYFSSPNRNASAHYFVDSDNIVQTVEDYDVAWHCGGKKYVHPKARNNNAIGIEMCSRKDSKGQYYIDKAVVEKTIYLTKALMKKYKIPTTNVIRHYDVTGKICPEPFVKNQTLWDNFKKELDNVNENNIKMVNRSYKYGEKLISTNVLVKQGEYYVRVRDLAELLNKNVVFEPKNKTTEFKEKE